VSTTIRSGGSKAGAFDGAAAKGVSDFNGSSARTAATAAVTGYKPLSPPLNFADSSAHEVFGANVFSKAVMEARRFDSFS